jgi:hypothetical protein
MHRCDDRHPNHHVRIPTNASEQPPLDLKNKYVEEVLQLYLATPTVVGPVRRADHIYAENLFRQRVPLYAIANAFIVGAARRILHNGYYASPMPPVRSLHYFRNIIQEMLDRPPGYREIAILKEKLTLYLDRNHWR